MDDDMILARGGTQEDIDSFAHDNGACGAIMGGTCDYCGKTDEIITDEEAKEIKNTLNKLYWTFMVISIIIAAYCLGYFQGYTA